MVLEGFSLLLCHFLPPVMMSNHSNERVGYKREHLMGTSRTQPQDPQVAQELTRRCCVCRAGAKQRKGKQKFKAALLSIIMGNVRSFTSKMEELEALMRTNGKFRQSSIMCFTKTWLHEHILDYSI